MSLQPVVLDDFKGLDFRVDRVGGGVVLAHNVMLDNGRLFRRWGASTAFTGAAIAGYVNALHYAYDDAGGYLLVGDTSDLRAYDTSGGLIDTEAYVSYARFADVSTPGTSATYIVNGVATPRTFDGTAFATPVFTGVTPTGAATVAVTPWDNRVMYGGTNANPSRVYFSDPGDPTTVGTDNYVDLSPGDSDSIQEIVTWRDLVFVFKATKFYVFYGTSTDSTGGPVFNYRAVTNTVGTGQRRADHAGNAGPPTVRAHNTGVYFTSADRGVYRTTGGQAELLSDPIRYMLMEGNRVSGATVCGDAISPFSVGADNRYVYVSSTDPSTLMFDTLSGRWTTTSIGGGTVGFVAQFATDGNNNLYFTRPTFSVNVGVWNSDAVDPDVETDFSGTAIPAFYRTGWMDMGPAAVEKELRDTVVHGFGTVNAGWLRDYGTTPSATSLALGTYSAKLPGRKHTRRAERGALYALNLSNTAGAFFDVSRVEAYVREVRPAGSRTTG